MFQCLNVGMLVCYYVCMFLCLFLCLFNVGVYCHMFMIFGRNTSFQILLTHMHQAFGLFVMHCFCKFPPTMETHVFLALNSIEGWTVEPYVRV